MQLHSQKETGGLELSPLQVPTQGNTVYGGTHGLFSSAQDYLRFCQMILHEGTWNGSQILSKETVTLCLRIMLARYWGQLEVLYWALG